MKKITVLALLLSLSLPSIPAFAADEIKATSLIDESYGIIKEDDGVYLDKRYVYAGYDGVDLTGMKSIEITAVNTVSGNVDGDTIWVKIDDPKGTIVSTVYIDKDTAGTEAVFKGAIEDTRGVHKLYLVSATADKDRKGTKIKSFKLSEEEYVSTEYIPVPDEYIIDTNSTTWAFTDALGRKAATYAEAGPEREGRYAALFYHTWHTASSQALNMSEFAKEHPEAKYDYYNLAWPQGIPTAYFWNEPLFGYYSSSDYWVARKHGEMLANAGVDVIVFDCTNGTNTFRDAYETVLTAFSDARANGVNVPKFCFMNNIQKTESYSKEKALKIYYSIYEPEKWSDLWFYWEGKPLLLTYQHDLTAVDGDLEDEFIVDSIKDFFTFRSVKSSYKEKPDEKDQWNWISVYPQEPFGDNGDGTFEQMVVCAAANYSYALDKGTAMNSMHTTGRSYTHLLGQDKSEGAYKYGYFFTEQVDRVLEVDPEVMFITGWNEWTAGRYAAWKGVLNASPDTYDNEASRDFEPTKGDMGDNYYWLMVDAIRKFKGTKEIPVASEPKSININSLSDWQGVSPVYLNNEGTYTRNCKGFSNATYTNDTARNNVIKSLAARDSENLYFYAECPVEITAPSGSAWMKLYIDKDRNHATGWEGYDFVVNSPTPGAVSALDANGLMTEIGKAEYALSGSTLSVKIPRALVDMTGELSFEFKWVDNAEGDIMNFYVDGNSAPMGRFNYIYIEKADASLDEAAKTQLKGTTVVGKYSSLAYVSGKKMYMYEPDTRYGARIINGVTYIPTYFLQDALKLRTIYESDRGMLKLMGEKRVYTTLGSAEAHVNGVLVPITNSATQIDGIPYIPVTFLNEVLGLEIYDTWDRVAFGVGINTSAADLPVF